MTFEIFISHIHSEREYAMTLKNQIESDFSRFKIFVSSDDESTAAGLLTQQIIKALEESKFVIVLCSKESVTRPWVAFETGIAHALGNEPRILFYSGMSSENIPSPFNQFLCRAMTFKGLEWLYSEISSEFNSKLVPKEKIKNSYTLLKNAEDNQIASNNFKLKVQACNAVGGLVYRYNQKKLEILLIRTKDSNRYIFPKGSVPKTANHEVILKQELMEEAGITGCIINSITPEIIQYTKGNGNNQNIAIHAVCLISEEPPLEITRTKNWYQFDTITALLKEGRDYSVYTPIIQALIKLHSQIKAQES